LRHRELHPLSGPHFPEAPEATIRIDSAWLRGTDSSGFQKLGITMTHTKVQIADLRPTQLTLGFSEVAERAAKLEKQSPTDRKSYLEKKAIPHVIGPGKRIYMVDHHHLARALWSINIREAVLGDTLADWSDLDDRPFWRKMEKNGYCWPIDTDGNRRPFAAIPHHVSELADNVWRSLARRVRGEAFEDQDTPFQEFIWGDYFRTFMSRRLIELKFDLAVGLAIKLALLAEAEDLPGFFHREPRSK
jgi:hypothetical protein